jgi:mono/diheme cytochrome c family protein
MSSRRRWLQALAGVAALALVVFMATCLSDAITGERAVAKEKVTPELVARGAYLAKLGDCAACHSIAGQPPFSGGLKMGLPIGAIYTSNITPDTRYGIGSYTLADFDRALRFGVSKGHTLYPAMPFPSYANTRPEDVEALYAYFEHGVTPAAVPNRKPDIHFPLSMRWPLTLWRWAFAPHPTPFAPAPNMDPIVARGAYFVEGLGHCGECHTPRSVALQVKAQTASAGDAFLSGAAVENWFAPSLRTGGAGSLASWTEAEIADYLRTGTNHHGIVFGSMSDVILNSSQYMTPGDAMAAARFIKTLRDASAAQNPLFSYDDRTARRLKSGRDEASGAAVYLDNCAACHRPDGRGYDGVFPQLAGNPVLLAPDPRSLVSIVLGGSATPRTSSTPAQFTMPAFAWRLTDQQAADVVSFIRHSWGNDAAPIDVTTVSRLRRDLTK